MNPGRCDHPNFIKVEPARWVYGTPGATPARYRCPDCKVYWDSFEPPEEPAGQWFHIETKGPQVWQN